MNPIAEERAKQLKETERARRLIPAVQLREALADVIGSAGWEAFINAIVTKFVVDRRNDALYQVERGDMSKAQACLAAADGALEIIFGAYEGTGQETPEGVRAIRRIGIAHEE
jgi:hypothetical protein